MTPAEIREAKRLLDELRDWGKVLRDSSPPITPLLGFMATASERIGGTAWSRFTATLDRLEEVTLGDSAGVDFDAPAPSEADKGE